SGQGLEGAFASPEGVFASPEGVFASPEGVFASPTASGIALAGGTVLVTDTTGASVVVVVLAGGTVLVTDTTGASVVVVVIAASDAAAFRAPPWPPPMATAPRTPATATVRTPTSADTGLREGAGEPDLAPFPAPDSTAPAPDVICGDGGG